MKPTIYIETSVVSYYTSRPSRDLIVAARQQITHVWWENYLKAAEVYISVLVIEEAEAGDVHAAKKRLDAVSDFPVLELSEQVLDLAKFLTKQGPIPENYFEDALHIALAAVNSIQFILTWNCRHINNPHMRADIIRAVQDFGYECPVICTPDEFMEGKYET